LSNTTLGISMATINASIIIIAMPDIFRGIHLNPLQPGNIGYLLWMLMGYLVVTAVIVVSLGRLGDIFGRVRTYNLGFAVFTVASVALALDPLLGSAGAMWLIGFRVVQGIGGAMLFSNSMAIVTDAFPAQRRGMAVGINQVASIAGGFTGLIVGGILGPIDWRLVFFISVPFGLLGTCWSYLSLHETAARTPSSIDWLGNAVFGLGLSAVLVAITYGVQPYRHDTMGWVNPWVLLGLIAGTALLIVFCFVEAHMAEPMFDMRLFRIKSFAAGNLAGFLAAVSRGGLQLVLIIWLQGIWLPLHGYSFSQTPIWAGIYLLPMTAAIVVAGPISGHLSDRYGARVFSTGGLALVALSFVGLTILPTNFVYWQFAALLVLYGLGAGLFASPNATAIMNSVPSNRRGAAAGMRSTFQNSGSALSIGIFFSLMIIGLSATLPRVLTGGLTAHGVAPAVAARIGAEPAVASLFAAFLGYNPVGTMLAQQGHGALAGADIAVLTSKEYFPSLISGPFHHGLIVAFLASAVMSLIAAVASLFRGERYVHLEEAVEDAGTVAAS
jgi:MFS family permease